MRRLKFFPFRPAFPSSARIHGFQSRRNCAHSRALQKPPRESPHGKRQIPGRFLGRPAGDGSRADEVLVKGEQGFVDFEDVIIAPPDEVFHDDIELAGMGHGIARLA